MTLDIQTNTKPPISNFMQAMILYAIGALVVWGLYKGSKRGPY